MGSKFEKYAATGPHLEKVGSVPIEAGGKMIVHKDHAFISARYGSSHALTIVDLTSPTSPTVTQTMRFKSNIAAVAMLGDTLLAAESSRALIFIDISDPTAPDYFDCGLALGLSIYDVAVCGEFAVLAMNWEGVGLMSLNDLSDARLIDKHKLDEGFVEGVVVANDHIFVAGASGGLRVFTIEDRALNPLGRISPDEFNASRISMVGDQIWCVGSEKILLVDPEDPTTVALEFDLNCSSPKALLPVEGGGALGFYDHYTCLAYDPQSGWAGELFKQFEADDDGAYVEIPCDESQMSEEDFETLHWSRSLTCMEGIDDAIVRDGHLFAVQSQEFNVYKLTEASVFNLVDSSQA